MRVLAVVAHPDDEVIGCGGTLARLSDEGHDVTALLVLKRWDERGIANWDVLVQAFHASCAILGVRSRVVHPAIEETLAITSVHLVHDALLPWVEEADVVFSHWNGDANQFHRALSQAVEIATRPFRRRKDVYLFETPSSTDQAYTNTFAPNTYSLLTADQADRKCKAMQCYFLEYAHGRRPEDLRRRMELRGVEVGAELAEAFVVARQTLLPARA